MLEVILLIFVLIAAALTALNVIADFLPSRAGTDLNTYTIGTFLLLVLFVMALEAPHYLGNTKDARRRDVVTLGHAHHAAGADLRGAADQRRR
jgi:hypothetical protein